MLFSLFTRPTPATVHSDALEIMQLHQEQLHKLNCELWVVHCQIQAFAAVLTDGQRIAWDRTTIEMAEACGRDPNTGERIAPLSEKPTPVEETHRVK